MVSVGKDFRKKKMKGCHTQNCLLPRAGTQRFLRELPALITHFAFLYLTYTDSQFKGAHDCFQTKVEICSKLPWAEPAAMETEVSPVTYPARSPLSLGLLFCECFHTLTWAH